MEDASRQWHSPFHASDTICAEGDVFAGIVYFENGSDCSLIAIRNDYIIDICHVPVDRFLLSRTSRLVPRMFLLERRECKLAVRQRK